MLSGYTYVTLTVIYENRHSRKEPVEENEILSQLGHVQDAYHTSNKHKLKSRFLEGTFKKLLAELQEWKQSPDTKPVYVLVGEAGFGKSTIASAFCQILSEEKRLGASFFFARDVDELSTPEQFFRTIAVQLARFQNGLRTNIIRGAREHLKRGSKQQIKYQYEDLVAEPLSQLPTDNPPIFIVVDALDECASQTRDDVCLMLRLLLSAAMCSRQLRIFLTTRPEPLYIHDIFDLDLFRSHISKILIQDFSSDEDIKTVITTRLSDYAWGKRWADAFPEKIDHLVETCNVFFLYAEVAVTYLIHHPHLLDKRYAQLTAGTTSTKPLLTEIDTLYGRIVDDIMKDLDDTDMQASFTQILEYLVTLQDPDGMTPETLERLVGMPSKDSIPILNKLTSLVFFERDKADSRFRICHATFRDFLIRSPSLGHVVNEAEVHRRLAAQCMNAMRIFVTQHWQQNAGAVLLLRLLTEPFPNLLNFPHIIYANQYYRYHLDHGKEQESVQTSDPFIASVVAYVNKPTYAAMWDMMMRELRSFRGLPFELRSLVDALLASTKTFSATHRNSSVCLQLRPQILTLNIF